MRRRIRLAVVMVALIASGFAAVPASAGVTTDWPPGKPAPTSTDKASPKPDQPKPSDEQLKKRKQQEAGPDGKRSRGLSDAQLADLARGIGVSKFRLIQALTHAKRATADPRQITPAVVRAFADELNISPRQARKVLTFVFQAPDKKDVDKQVGDKKDIDKKYGDKQDGDKKYGDKQDADKPKA
jgi:hypothetical protein